MTRTFLTPMKYGLVAAMLTFISRPASADAQ